MILGKAFEHTCLAVLPSSSFSAVTSEAFHASKPKEFKLNSCKMMLRSTPSTTIHRALPIQPLNWEYKPRRPRDGDLKSAVDPATGVKTYTLYAQPRKQHKYTGEPIYFGVSFFEPYPQFFKAIHQHLTNAGASALGGAKQGCAVLLPDAVLPDGVALVNDGKLSIPLEGDDRIECGEHYTLFATRSMSTAAFDDIYAELVANSSSPCELKATAAPVDLQLDMDCYPADKLTCAAMMALDALSSEATDPNVRQRSCCRRKKVMPWKLFLLSPQ